MRKIVAVFVLAAALVGCGTTGEQGTVGKGNKHYGGVFNANETQDLEEIFPLSLTSAHAHRISSQIHEGLLRLDPNDLSPQPCLAESWESDSSGLVYVFHLRKGVHFHDDPCFPDGKGREFVAEDVMNAFTELCTDSKINRSFWLFQDLVLGANEHFEATHNGQMARGGVEGVVALDPHTVRITLTHRSANFLHIMAHQGCWIFPKEEVVAYPNALRTHAVGTGPFKMKAFRQGEAMILERNNDYWRTDEDGNRLPYLDAVRFTFLQDKGMEMDQFLKGRLSVLYEIPPERAGELKDSVSADGKRRFTAQMVPGMAVQFYGFNQRVAPLNDPRVRRAFALSIDRAAIARDVMGGMVVPAEHGIVAPGMKGYPYDSVPGHGYDPDSARALLANAGFPGGKGFPSLLMNVNSNGFGYVAVAEAVQAMLKKELGITLGLSVLPDDQHYDRTDLGTNIFWRQGWVADYPDPENFLALFYGKNVPADSTQPSFINSVRYRDPAFDRFFAAAQATADEAERLRLMAAAERVMMDDAAATPLYHERGVRLIQPWVRNFPINAMEIRDLATVWFDPALKPVN
ncbi:MAG: ABC transporter substrate-binding protein [Flavobacteriales bacterium]